MTKIALSLMLLSILLGVGFHLWSWNQDLSKRFGELVKLQETEDKSRITLSIVYLKKQVGAGELITADCIGMRPAEINQVPRDSIINDRSAIGGIAKYDLYPGHVLHFYDILPVLQKGDRKAEPALE